MHAEMLGVPECELRMDARVTKCENNTVEDMKRRRLKKGREAGRDRELPTHRYRWVVHKGCGRYTKRRVAYLLGRGSVRYGSSLRREQGQSFEDA